MKYPFFFISALLFFNCIHLFAQNIPGKVVFLPLKMSPPPGARKIGTLKAGNNATATHCDYDALINSAKEKAAKMGGNIVKVTKLIAPAFISRCYKIEADVYYADKLPEYSDHTNDKGTARGNDRNAYALLCIYRLRDTIAFAPPYKLHLNNDSEICMVKNNSLDSIKLYENTPITLWAETEGKTELQLKVKKGETYYIRCGLKGGEIRMVPVLELVDKKTGAKELAGKKHEKKDMDVKYLEQIH